MYAAACALSVALHEEQRGLRRNIMPTIPEQIVEMIFFGYACMHACMSIRPATRFHPWHVSLNHVQAIRKRCIHMCLRVVVPAGCAEQQPRALGARRRLLHGHRE